MLESLFNHEKLRGSCIESASQFGAREENQTTQGNMLRAMPRKETTMTTESKTTNTSAKARVLANVQSMVTKWKKEREKIRRESLCPLVTN